MTDGVITAVVVRWRGGDEVDRCLQSLLSHGGPEIERIVLVDSGSGDGGGKRLAARYPDVEVVTLSENRSFAWSASQGAARGSEPLLLLLNPDTEIGKGTLEPLVRFIDDHPGVAGVVPLLVHPDGTPQHHWQLRRLPGAWRLALGLPGPPQFPTNPPKDPQPVEQPAASAWLVRRSVWQDLNGLDSDYEPAWWEDVDFCARLKASVRRDDSPASAGFTVVPSSRIVHAGGSSLASLTDEAFLTAYHRNLLRYATRHHPSKLGLIRRGLALSLRGRALLRPSRRAAYTATIRAIRRG